MLLPPRFDSIFKVNLESHYSHEVLPNICPFLAWWATVYGVAKSRTRLEWLSSKLNSGFPNDSAVKNPPAVQGDTGDTGLILVQEDPLGKGTSNPLQYSCLENPVDIGVWLATVHGVAKELEMTEHTQTYLCLHSYLYKLFFYYHVSNVIFY